MCRRRLEAAANRISGLQLINNNKKQTVIRRTKQPAKNVQGFTLIEVLIALVVVTVGMLGVAVLYVEGLRMNRTSLYRTTAVALATDMAERIRANQGQNQAADYAGNGPGQENNCHLADCTSAQLAEDDWDNWLASLETYLPVGAEAEITRPAPINGLQPLNITLRWPEIGRPDPVSYTLTVQL